METIAIRLNGENLVLDNTSLQIFLQARQIDVSYIAVAVNNEIVPSGKIPDITLKTGDTVEIVHAVCGG